MDADDACEGAILTVSHQLQGTQHCETRCEGARKIATAANYAENRKLLAQVSVLVPLLSQLVTDQMKEVCASCASWVPLTGKLIIPVSDSKIRYLYHYPTPEGPANWTSMVSMSY